MPDHKQLADVCSDSGQRIGTVARERRAWSGNVEAWCAYWGEESCDDDDDDDDDNKDDDKIKKSSSKTLQKHFTWARGSIIRCLRRLGAIVLQKNY